MPPVTNKQQIAGRAAWLVWRAGRYRHAKTALNLFLAQPLFNALWSWLFFGWQLGAVTFGEVLLLWVSFAYTLNYTLWQLNPQVL